VTLGVAQSAVPGHGFLQTGQTGCYDEAGRAIPCQGSGQDGSFRSGLAWPVPRFNPVGAVVDDLLTGLTWTADANPAEFPLSWGEALDYVRAMNARGEHGFSDWRLPNRRELRSLVSYQTRRPALPERHPFAGVFLGWYWTSTTAAINPAYAWYVHMDGARMFYGRKEQDYLLWPVRGGSSVLPGTGQRACYDQAGRKLPDPDPVQDGAGWTGIPWPAERFIPAGDGVRDRLTGLVWLRLASLSRGEVSWAEALRLVSTLNAELPGNAPLWRLPNINELESLVDCSQHSPALPAGHPFLDVREVYWSSTTSFFEPDWAWALYLGRGALGVGVKRARNFHVWPVRDGHGLPEEGSSQTGRII
jgi:hypothetical protein